MRNRWVEPVMKTLSIIYWSRVCLGIFAALLCVVLNIQSLLSGVSLGMLVYLFTNYVFKWLFTAKLEKPSKLITTGIGAYFFTWLVTWILFYTLSRGG